MIINCELGLSTAPIEPATYCAVMATYNSEKTVKEALNSILSQSISPNEIIIVDDASSDTTVKILNEIASENPRLRVFENKSNSGQSYSRNLAGSSSNSDLLIFFDDDDVSHSMRAEEHLQMYKNGSDFSFVSSVKRYQNMYEIVCENSECRALKLDPSEMLRRLVLGKQSYNRENLWIPASTSAIDRAFFLSIGGYDVDMRRLEDAEIVIRAALMGCTASWSSKILVLRNSTTSIAKGGTVEMDHEKCILLKYQDLLSKAEIRRALKLIEIRRAYFSRNYRRLLLLSAVAPNLILGPNGRIFSFFRRVLHDRRRLS